MKNLIIVESPAKAKTIEKFLGKDYKVMSSFGHIRDLETKEFGSVLQGNFKPDYEVPADKRHLVSELKAAAKKADTVWLASDEDREGEAIAWHLYEVLGLQPENTRRIVFHEITKPAILHAIENPRDIDINLVNAQQARRVLDRLVGFELSPVLWRKIKPSLSAGRVQSVAVRLICEREMEIRTFKPEAYFRVQGFFKTADGKTFKSDLNKRMETEQDAQVLLQHIAGLQSFKVLNITKKPLKRSPMPPFTTSTLQQEAGRRLGFSVSQTMMVAQRLYEAGIISYMRTDSLNLSDLALKEIATHISGEYGAEYLRTRRYHTNTKGAQEAHEAIRPTYIANRKINGTIQEQRLYDLIWKRTVASQMQDAEIEKTGAEIAISGRSELFEAQGEVVSFDGFLKIYSNADEAADNHILPPLRQGEIVTRTDITATERHTQPPARYTEASLVKKMEELGIGRPSTYAPTISTIQSRDYIERGNKEGTDREYTVIKLDTAGNLSTSTLSEKTGSDKGKLVPTDIGMIVNRFLTEMFPDILDYNFTAHVEEKFDHIAEGKLGWQEEITDFYRDFHPQIEKVSTLHTEHKIGERILGTDPASGKLVSAKIGRFGPVAQIGETGDKEKPRFASLLKGQSIESITLEEALKLFELPRTLGEYEGKPVLANVGRFGPYIHHDKLFVSIPKTQTPQDISLQEAIDLIEAKRNEEANSILREYPDIPGLHLKNGRYGIYLAYKPDDKGKAENIRVPKNLTPEQIDSAKARELMEEHAKAKTSRPSSRRSRK